MIKFLKILKEQISDQIQQDPFNEDEYEDIDFFDVFFTLFKTWITKKYGEKYQHHPMSLLVRMKAEEFFKEMGVEISEDDLGNFSSYDIRKYTKELVKMGKAKLPNIKRKGKFLERYGNVLQDFVSKLNLPSNISLEFEENTPYVVRMIVYDDIIKKMQDESGRSTSRYTLRDKIGKYIENYLGIEIGNPAHGKLEIQSPEIETLNLDKFKKEFVKKKIRPALQEAGFANKVKSIRISSDGGASVGFKLVFNSETWQNDPRKQAQKIVKKVLDDNGFKNTTVTIW